MCTMVYSIQLFGTVNWNVKFSCTVACPCVPILSLFIFMQFLYCNIYLLYTHIPFTTVQMSPMFNLHLSVHTYMYTILLYMYMKGLLTSVRTRIFCTVVSDAKPIISGSFGYRWSFSTWLTVDGRLTNFDSVPPTRQGIVGRERLERKSSPNIGLCVCGGGGGIRIHVSERLRCGSKPTYLEQLYNTPSFVLHTKHTHALHAGSLN